MPPSTPAPSTAAQPYPPTSSLPPIPPRERPLGVALLAVLVGIFGFLLIVSGILIIAAVGIGTWGQYLGQVTQIAGLTGIVLGVIVLVVGLIILGLAVGLWRLRMWALALTLLFLIFELIVYVLDRNFYSVGFILALVLFVYLLAVNRHFR